MLVKFGLWIPIFSMIPDSLACIPGSKAQDSRFHRFPRDGARRERLYSQRPSFLFFHHLWQCVEFHWLQAPLGVSLSFSFPFLHSCARVLDISPFALIKPGACYASYNNLKVESVNSVTNCILMSDPLVLFWTKIRGRLTYINQLIISEQDIKNYNFQPRKRIKREDYQPFLSIFFFFFGFRRHIGFWESTDATRSAASFSNRACLSTEKTFLDY